MFLKKIFFGALIFTFCNSYCQVDNGDKMFTKLIKVNKDIYMLQAKGGNIGLSIGSDGIFMIDDQYAEGIEQIQEEIKKKSQKPVEFLLNTHFHGDHTGGNPAMAETGTTILSQNNVRERLLQKIKNSTEKISEKVLPVITFSEDLTFYYNGEKIYVFHVHNAHTDGDAMVYFLKSNVLHTGDVLFNGKYPFIDLENGGSVEGYIQAIQKAKLIINEDTKIIPGHGDVATPKDLDEELYMLSKVSRMVTTEYLKKKSEDEVAKMTNITADYDAKDYGKGFISTEAFLRTIYKDVANGMEGRDSNNEKNRKAAERIEQIKKDRAAAGKDN